MVLLVFLMRLVSLIVILSSLFWWCLPFIEKSVALVEHYFETLVGYCQLNASGNLHFLCMMCESDGNVLPIASLLSQCILSAIHLCRFVRYVLTEYKGCYTSLYHLYFGVYAKFNLYFITRVWIAICRWLLVLCVSMWLSHTLRILQCSLFG